MNDNIMKDFAQAFLNTLRRHDEITAGDLMLIVSSLAVTTLRTSFDAENLRDYAIASFNRNVNAWYAAVCKRAADSKKGGAEPC